MHEGDDELMPRTSVIARHEKRDQIERDILNLVPTRTIRAKYHISLTAIHNYKQIIKDRIELEKAKIGWRAIDYLEEMEKLRQKALKGLDAAEAADVPPLLKISMVRSALYAAGEFTEKLARFAGQSHEQKPTTNVQVNIFEVMPTIRRILERHPAVMREVQEALGGNGNGHA